LAVFTKSRYHTSIRAPQYH